MASERVTGEEGRRRAAILSLLVCLVLRTAGLVGESEAASRPGGNEDWPVHGKDDFNSRYSALDGITRENVHRLEVAWTYRTGETTPEFATKRPKLFETTPIVVDGRLFVSSSLARVIALEPDTGREVWTFDPKIDRNLLAYAYKTRGVSTWLDPAAKEGAPCRRRIYVGTTDARLIAVDAANGKVCSDFGQGGTVDARHGLRNSPSSTNYALRSPAAVVNGVVVVGSTVQDNERADAPSGAVRAYDARTGRLRWSWDPIPQDPSDPAFSAWKPAQALRTGGANAWSLIVADSARDLVFVPTSSPSPDEYGGLRLGNNLYADSLVALKASTGKRVWHQQLVHHNLWDYDVATPSLITVKRDGKDVPAVLLATKTNQLFLFHRETGQPLVPMEERKVPASTVPGEETWPTQPFSSLPLLGPQRLTAEDAWGPTPADREACREKIAGLRNEGIFTPPSLEGTLLYPAQYGGAEWGGATYDPVREIAVAAVNRGASVVKLVPREEVDESKESSPMKGTPYVMRRTALVSPSGMPCVPPPFGALVAVSLKSRQKLWDVPLGTTGGHPGSQNAGGAVVTASGLVFVGATQDRYFRAFDIETGKKLWEAALPAGARANPMTYSVAGGRQYVVVTAGGGGEWGDGDYVIAFALPASEGSRR